ncbi:MAG: adenosylcobinamide-GDP ribazoletransferase [Zetaproteobacteria bacterium]|nr:MAG: adenosylcobinamide-GDP ribazoletransferase [Zetaproteobacteria bacterium]
MRAWLSALALLTRLPVAIHGQSPCDPGQAARWFPAVGLLVGMLLATMAAGVDEPPLLRAWLVLLAWVWLTGAMHLDGVADMSDGLASAHGDPARLRAVMKEPHVGAFGVVAVVLVLLSKFAILATHIEPASLVLTPAWARLGVLLWAEMLPPLAADGMGAALAGRTSRAAIAVWALGLAVVSGWLISAAFVLAAALALLAWAALLHRWVGGMNGDCLGAGIECCECALLFFAAIGH